MGGHENGFALIPGAQTVRPGRARPVSPELRGYRSPALVISDHLRRTAATALRRLAFLLPSDLRDVPQLDGLVEASRCRRPDQHSMADQPVETP